METYNQFLRRFRSQWPLNLYASWIRVLSSSSDNLWKPQPPPLVSEFSGSKVLLHNPKMRWTCDWPPAFPSWDDVGNVGMGHCTALSHLVKSQNHLWTVRYLSGERASDKQYLPLTMVMIQNDGRKEVGDEPPATSRCLNFWRGKACMNQLLRSYTRDCYGIKVWVYTR